MSKKVLVVLLCVALMMGAFVSLAVPSYAQGVDCSIAGGGLFPYANATWIGPHELTPDGGSRYELKVSQAPTQAPHDGFVAFYFGTVNYQTKKYQFTGNVGYASWFGLGGNWADETTTVTHTGKWIYAANGSPYGPDYAYETRPYKQMYQVSARKVTVDGVEKWVYCTPCRVRLATLHGSPAIAFETEPKPIYVPALRGASDACALHTQ